MKFTYLQIKLNVHMQQTYFVVLTYTDYVVMEMFQKLKKSGDNYSLDRIFTIVGFCEC